MKFRWHYVLYMTGFIVLLVVLGELNDYFDSKQRATFNVFPWEIIAALSYLSIGGYLGLPLLIKEYNKTGKWRVNLQKLTLIGLPSLYLASSWFIPTSILPAFLFHSYEELSLGGIIATGYIATMSFTKESK
ncbi:hypothetical protein [Pseudalkalibacillus hwajinpoensis]|uniref:Uncharacterized protein n=1 Tax=Guptibacillus hwajinpoensis TaxID=208199 RepID=A0A4U1M9A7_9BACL|nr:hypothetical protein [Pseudalkalibacillus hwajinpoensis]TKD66460.1 hypothetical protein FBF83_20180 [Pseudalkalibacillus hwajinpoensis]